MLGLYPTMRSVISVMATARVSDSPIAPKRSSSKGGRRSGVDPSVDPEGSELSFWKNTASHHVGELLLHPTEVEESADEQDGNY